jgi:hypothetical protein
VKTAADDPVREVREQGAEDFPGVRVRGKVALVAGRILYGADVVAAFQQMGRDDYENLAFSLGGETLHA